MLIKIILQWLCTNKRILIIFKYLYLIVLLIINTVNKIIIFKSIILQKQYNMMKYHISIFIYYSCLLNHFRFFFY